MTTIERIIEISLRVANITAEDLRGKSRHERILLARELIATLGRKHTTLSFPEITRACGMTTHSTIFDARRRMLDRPDEAIEVGDLVYSRSDWLKEAERRVWPIAASKAPAKGIS
jgi:chromosomal replication initiation ATPase DnaA